MLSRFASFWRSIMPDIRLFPGSPYLSGLLRSMSGDFVVDWVFHACCVVGLMLLTLRFVPSRYPQEWSATE
ncbi:hypothetical protein GCM10011445_33210 [Pseudocitrobacter faecalis]|nr:hypothetical protein GCM10011445_33210 [Pseudocitrobacter faecalis]